MDFLTKLNIILESNGVGSIPSSKIYYRIALISSNREGMYEDYVDVLRFIQNTKYGDYGSITTFYNIGEEQAKDSPDWLRNIPYEYYVFTNHKTHIGIEHQQDAEDMGARMNDYGLPDSFYPPESKLAKYVGPKGTEKNVKNVSPEEFKKRGGYKGIDKRLQAIQIPTQTRLWRH